ncbi:hypothetical protein B0H16DRAFT_422229 [Mycena metata]|uniref:Uncharacterized protein n=1 Tax=Mycena metata TaxID=1033252 RepID=A0AAD7HE71_9AGAR|nr:hypothetical protein B0H16DRAFT_422229 [Mycena metata]
MHHPLPTSVRFMKGSGGGRRGAAARPSFPHPSARTFLRSRTSLDRKRTASLSSPPTPAILMSSFAVYSTTHSHRDYKDMHGHGAVCEVEGRRCARRRCGRSNVGYAGGAPDEDRKTGISDRGDERECDLRIVAHPPALVHPSASSCEKKPAAEYHLLLICPRRAIDLTATAASSPPNASGGAETPLELRRPSCMWAPPTALAPSPRPPHDAPARRIVPCSPSSVPDSRAAAAVEYWQQYHPFPPSSPWAKSRCCCMKIVPPPLLSRVLGTSWMESVGWAMMMREGRCGLMRPDSEGGGSCPPMPVLLPHRSLATATASEHGRRDSWAEC